ncbi:MAG: hypothetical protein PVJ57_18805 [Phycisphaerae bacterium]|jgi:hypothetical protein
MISVEPKRCLGCGYILDHLPENRCPECGRAFDPDDPETFAHQVVDGRLALRTALSAVGATLLAVSLPWLIAVSLALLRVFVDPSDWGGSSGDLAGGVSMALLILALALEVAAIFDVWRALRLPRYAVSRREEVFYALIVTFLLPIGVGLLCVLA